MLREAVDLVPLELPVDSDRLGAFVEAEAFLPRAVGGASTPEGFRVGEVLAVSPVFRLLLRDSAADSAFDDLLFAVDFLEPFATAAPDLLILAVDALDFELEEPRASAPLDVADLEPVFGFFEAALLDFTDLVSMGFFAPRVDMDTSASSEPARFRVVLDFLSLFARAVEAGRSRVVCLDDDFLSFFEAVFFAAFFRLATPPALGPN